MKMPYSRQYKQQTTCASSDTQNLNQVRRLHIAFSLRVKDQPQTCQCHPRLFISQEIQVRILVCNLTNRSTNNKNQSKLCALNLLLKLRQLKSLRRSTKNIHQTILHLCSWPLKAMVLSEDCTTANTRLSTFQVLKMFASIK